MFRVTAICSLCLSFSLLSGCGGESAVGGAKAKTVPFNGKVTLDGQSHGGVNIQFLPQSSDGGARTAYADVKADGSFSATTYVTGDGIVPGKYTVKVGKAADGASTDPAAMMAAVSGQAIESIDIDVPADGLTDIELKLKSVGGGQGNAGPAMLGQ